MPLPRPLNPWWGVMSLALHAVAAAALVSVGGPSLRLDEPTYIVLTDPAAPGPREFRLPEFGNADLGQGGEGGREGTRAPRTVTLEMPDSIPTFTVDTVFRIVGLPSPRPGVDSAPGEGLIGTRRRLGPAYAGGWLWVRPFDARLGVVGESETRAIHIARIDVAIRERIKSFIDTMPRDSFALPPPQIWTTEVDGATWGIDQTWIYLGDFKIPTALLALLPFPMQDWDRAQDARELARVREDIIRAARRSEDAKEFRKYVNELRKRKEAERKEKQLAKRDTVVPVKPIPPP